MAYTAKDGKKFGNHQQGKRYDEVRAGEEPEKPQIAAHEDTLDEQHEGESVACPHCGGEVKLTKHDAAEEAKESPAFEKGEKEGAHEYAGISIPGM